MMSRLVFFTNRSNEQSAYCFGNIIAEKMGMPIDIPAKELRPDDTLIMVKCLFKNAREVAKRVKKIYYQIGCGWLKFHEHIWPNISLITSTPRACAIYKSYYPRNEVVWIPLQHSNYEDIIRPLDRPVRKIVFNGTRSSFPDDLWNEFKQKIEKKGFETVRVIVNETLIRKGEEYRCFCRDLWLNGDIAVSFRQTIDEIKGHVELGMKPPNKLNGAGSVQVPSVAYPEICFVENNDKPGCFLAATTIDEMVKQCCNLRDDKELYARIVKQAYEDALSYHIDKVIPYYWKLLNGEDKSHKPASPEGIS